MRILIAEDDALSRLLMQKVLERVGYQPLLAADGAEAWTLFQQERPELVISDWMMPALDGLALCRRIRAVAESNGYTYVMIVSALSGKANFLQGMDAGADDFITKPFDADELIARVRAAERLLGALRPMPDPA